MSQAEEKALEQLRDHAATSVPDVALNVLIKRYASTDENTPDGARMRMRALGDPSVMKNAAAIAALIERQEPDLRRPLLKLAADLHMVAAGKRNKEFETALSEMQAGKFDAPAGLVGPNDKLTIQRAKALSWSYFLSNDADEMTVLKDRIVELLSAITYGRNEQMALASEQQLPGPIGVFARAYQMALKTEPGGAAGAVVVAKKAVDEYHRWARALKFQSGKYAADYETVRETLRAFNETPGFGQPAAEGLSYARAVAAALGRASQPPGAQKPAVAARTSARQTGVTGGDEIKLIMDDQRLGIRQKAEEINAVLSRNGAGPVTNPRTGAEVHPRQLHSTKELARFASLANHQLSGAVRSAVQQAGAPTIVQAAVGPAQGMGMLHAVQEQKFPFVTAGAALSSESIGVIEQRVLDKERLDRRGTAP